MRAALRAVSCTKTTKKPRKDGAGLTDAYKEACDHDGDGTVTAADHMGIKNRVKRK